MTETIYALSSAHGRGGVAIIRVSGDGALDTLQTLSTDVNSPKPRMANYCNFSNPKTNDLIDRGIAIYFKAPNSFTGEDIVEYHIHGGQAGVEALLNALALCENTRMAEAGEFTKQAVLNGKIDLTEAEAIADLINAETEIQHKLAIGQHAGQLRHMYEEWTKKLSKLLAYQEAEIEFPDEDIPEGLSADILPELKVFVLELENHLNDNHKGERLREGISIVILGAPNAGKSSLINALAKRDIAIVSNKAGTTRDVLEAHLNLAGYPVIVSDTAGLHDSTNDEIEQEGIKRAYDKATNSDIKIIMFDIKEELSDEILEIKDENTIIVANKIDTDSSYIPDNSYLSLSIKTGEGLDLMLEKLTTLTKEKYSLNQNNTPLLTRKRHRDNLEKCHEHLKEALNNDMAELAAEDMRMALRYLGRLTGRVDIEDLLDIIFKDFCIGK